MLMVFFGIWIKPKAGLSQVGEDKGEWVGSRAVAMGMETPCRVLEGSTSLSFGWEGRLEGAAPQTE